MITSPDIDRYLAEMVPTHDAVLREMEAEAARTDFPIVGPLVGRLLHLLARAIGARRVFEMGSGFGYSTFWFAHAVGDGGEVFHTDRSEERSRRAFRYLARAGLDGPVRFHTGEAIDILRHTEGMFDVIFLDQDKEPYPAGLRAARARVRPGGLILADNVLWHGQPAGDDDDPATRAIREYNRTAFSAPDLESAIVPLRDGVGIHLKVRTAAELVTRH
jgi:predicted O-methyltransferase YrrM